MKKDTDSKAESKWYKSDISYQNHQKYLLSKEENQFELTFIDLLYISNFKGGYATINEKEDDINKKLKFYSEKIIEIRNLYGDKHLNDLSDKEIDSLIRKVDKICDLTKKENTTTSIDGFRVSYLSALLNSYFPNLIPILDRRVLCNLGLVNKEELDKYGQVKNIQIHYEKLIRKFAELMETEKKSMRELDREWFIKNILEI